MFRKLVTACITMTVFFSVVAISHADDLQEISSNINSTPELVSKGKSLYTSSCASCHGNEGKGDGAAAAAFNPKPRNFVQEKFKQGSSPAATFYTLTNGLGSMPSFASLSVADRMALVHFVLSLSPNKQADTAETLAKIGLDPSGKPMAGFKSEKAEELPVEFMIEKMATDGNVDRIDYKVLLAHIEAEKKAAKEASVVVAVEPDLSRGKVLFESCQICHGQAGQGTQLAGAPQIAGQDFDYLVTQLKNFQQGIRGAHPEDVNGLKMRPMSRLLRSEADLLSVAKYVSEMPQNKPEHILGAGDPVKGQAAFGSCMACHGADAKGMKAMHAPSLVGLQDWYMAEQIKKFKAGIRAGDSRDVGGATMRGMSMSVTDDQMVMDIVSYISTLSK